MRRKIPLRVVERKILNDEPLGHTLIGSKRFFIHPASTEFCAFLLNLRYIKRILHKNRYSFWWRHGDIYDIAAIYSHMIATGHTVQNIVNAMKKEEQAITIISMYKIGWE